MNRIECRGAHAERATSRHWGALAAAGLLLCAIGCAAPAKELAGPAEAKRVEGGRFDAEYVTTTRREGARQPLILLRPQRPVATVILFPGGNGAVGINRYGIKRQSNFLVRSRFLFADHDLMVAVVDPPSDRENLDGFRTSQAHALDIKGVIAYLREQAPAPVWLVGTSYGTVSAIMVADWLADEGGPDGVVLTSSLFHRGRIGDSVFDANPARIRIPLLLVHHRNDRCRATPFSEADTFVKRMYNAHPAELIAFDGGGPVQGDWCEPFDYHGYPGLEPQVVDTIAKWIVAHGRN